MLIRRGAAAVAASLVLVAATARPASADPADFVKAWRTTQGRGVTVAVLSSGVDPGVHALAGALDKGADFVKNGSQRRVMGTLIATGIAGRGTGGLAPAARILPVRIYPDSRDPGALHRGIGQNGLAMAAGIRYAADQHAQVISIAGWYWLYQPEISSAVTYAQAKGAIVVAAAERLLPSEPASFPANLPGVIGVGAVDGQGHRKAKYTARASSVLVSGPGDPLTAPGPGDSHTWAGNTPAKALVWVTATAALVRAAYPKLPPGDVARAIAHGAHHPKGGYDPSTGFGLVNPAGALTEAAALQKAPIRISGGTFADRDHFAPPVPVDAVHRNNGLLAGAGAAALAGLLLVVGGGVLWFRRSKKTTAADPEPEAP